MHTVVGPSKVRTASSASTTLEPIGESIGELVPREVYLDLAALEDLLDLLEAALPAVTQAPGAAEVVGPPADEVLRARASRLTDLRQASWPCDWRAAVAALAAGRYLAGAALTVAPEVRDAARARWWLVMATADRIGVDGAVGARPAVRAALARAAALDGDDSPLVHRAFADGVGVALAEALVAAGRVAAVPR